MKKVFAIRHFRDLTKKSVMEDVHNILAACCGPRDKKECKKKYDGKCIIVGKGITVVGRRRAFRNCKCYKITVEAEVML